MIENQIDVNVCDADVTDQYVNNINLSIGPNPIQIKAGRTIRINFRIHLLKEIPVGSRIKLKLHKDILPLSLCVDVS